MPTQNYGHARQAFSMVTSALAVIAGTVFVSVDQSARAESEASSEAGLEAPTLARRRYRRIHRQEVRKERAHELQVRSHQQKTDRRLENRPEKDFVHNYGSGHRIKRQEQPQRTQNN